MLAFHGPRSWAGSLLSASQRCMQVNDACNAAQHAANLRVGLGSEKVQIALGGVAVAEVDHVDKLVRKRGFKPCSDIGVDLLSECV